MKHDLRMRLDRLLGDSRALVAESRSLSSNLENLKRHGAALRQLSDELVQRTQAISNED